MSDQRRAEIEAKVREHLDAIMEIEHGWQYAYQEANPWAARTWPAHVCFIGEES